MNTDRVNIICEVYGTTLERLRRFKRATGNDLKAMKEIARYLRDEEFQSFEEIGDLLFKDRTTIMWHLRKVNDKQIDQQLQTVPENARLLNIVHN